MIYSFGNFFQKQYNIENHICKTRNIHLEMKVFNTWLAGMPFREAYRTVGQEVQRGEYKPVRSVNHTHLGSIGNLATDRIASKMESVMKTFE